MLLSFRSFLGSGTPAQWPSCNRVCEMVCIKLCSQFQSPKKDKSGTTPRFHLVAQRYREVRAVLLHNARLLEETNIVLPEINLKTLSQW